jgi:hypothetical protein
MAETGRSMTRLACLGLLLALAACSGARPPESTRFEPLDAGRFRFIAPADSAHPLTDPLAEHTRLRWLEQALAQRQLCPAGYRIDRRDPQAKDTGISRPVAYGRYDVLYEGSCI